jgi:DNA-binding MarR family transcriptional regulator
LEIGRNFGMAATDELGLVRFCMCGSVRRAGRALTNLYDEILAPSGVRLTQFSLLGHLAEVGEMTLTRLAEVRVMDRTTLTRNLTLLERDGLVTVTPGTDKRTRVVRITEAGHEAVQRAFPYWRAAQRRVRAELGDEQFNALLNELEGLVELTR